MASVFHVDGQPGADSDFSPAENESWDIDDKSDTKLEQNLRKCLSEATTAGISYHGHVRL